MAKKQITARDMVNILRERGFNVEFKERSDKGIRITRINEEKFKASTGITKAREILGLQLSERRSYQLRKIGSASNKPKKNDIIPQTLDKQIKRVQRLLRKSGIQKGTATKRQLRYVISKYGVAEAQRRLNQAERYARGSVYLENLITFRNRLINDNAVLNSSDLESSINKLNYIIEKDEGMYFKESDLTSIIEIYYDLVHKNVETSAFVHSVNIILDKYIDKYIDKKNRKA